MGNQVAQETLNYLPLKRRALIIARARMDKLIERETSVAASANIGVWVETMLKLSESYSC